jgi:hypothetical protein
VSKKIRAKIDSIPLLVWLSNVEIEVDVPEWVEDEEDIKEVVLDALNLSDHVYNAAGGGVSATHPACARLAVEPDMSGLLRGFDPFSGITILND